MILISNSHAKIIPTSISTLYFNTYLLSFVKKLYTVLHNEISVLPLLFKHLLNNDSAVYKHVHILYAVINFS